MNEDIEFIYKIRQLLNQGTVALDASALVRLHQARQIALNQQRLTTSNVDLTLLVSVGNWVERQIYNQARSLVIVVALGIGTIGTYYWNGAQQAQEREEIDSALLTDELPPSAYLDPGFQAWLEPASYSSSQ